MVDTFEERGTRNIVRLGDICRATAWDTRVVDVAIHLDASRPPRGVATLKSSGSTGETAARVEFVGWLGLMRALYTLLGEPRGGADIRD